MMGRALLIVGWLATLGVGATGILGFQVGAEGERFGLHLVVALVSSLLLLFSHCWIMFYLIGTGKAIKEAVADHGLEDDLVERTKVFKNRSYPWLMLAMGVAMTTFIVGGGVATRVMPAWIHQLLFYATVVVQLRALTLEGQVLAENERLMAGINRRLASAASSPSAEGATRRSGPSGSGA